MDHFDTRLRDRLQLLEANLPARAGTGAKRRSPRWTALVVAGVAVLALATGGAGATLVQAGVTIFRQGAAIGQEVLLENGHPGVFGPQGPLYCTRIQEMGPRQAAPILADLGYTVTWQVEDRDARTSTQTTISPADGFIIEGVLHGRDLTLVVERGAAAVPAGESCGR